MSNSIYNEDNYLNGDKENLRTFAKDYQDRQERWQQEKVKYGNIIKNYQEFINILANYLRSLNLKNSLEYSFLLGYLIDDGYLSFDKKFKPQAPDPAKEITSCLGTSIIAGKGCCRNYSRVQNEVFRKLNIPNFIYYCYEGVDIPALAKEAEANHVITLITYAEQVYGIDIYNKSRLFRFRDAFTLTEISTHSKHVLRYKPYIELIMGESSLPYIKERIEYFKKISVSPFINAFEYEEEIKYKVKRLIRELQKQCVPNEIHEGTEGLKKEIADEMQSLIK